MVCSFYPKQRGSAARLSRGGHRYRAWGKEFCRCRGYSKGQPEQAPKGETLEGCRDQSSQGEVSPHSEELGEKKASVRDQEAKGKAFTEN
ncbi:MAG: hypothetical protein GF317_13485 [Candidatus Lokiarchaeota archaeon]|nr:hypothetical protein [Candidatus Lokiarchaeota archaeon]MBD3200650.1 hypothetical protein [Candidatus Lokiarchaeota archaeon]